jgi:hypothetical protein
MRNDPDIGNSLIFYLNLGCKQIFLGNNLDPCQRQTDKTIFLIQIFIPPECLDHKKSKQIIHQFSPILILHFKHSGKI